MIARLSFAAVCLALLGTPASAQTSVFRYESWANAYSYEYSTTTVYDLATLGTIYETTGNTYLDSQYQYTASRDTLVGFSGPFIQRDTSGVLSATGAWSGSAQTGPGYNKAGVSLFGAASANQLFEAENTAANYGIRLTTEATRYATAQSRYDEIFLMTQAGNAPGSGQFTVNLTLTGMHDGVGSFYFSVTQFDSNQFQTGVYGLSSSQLYDYNLGGVQSFTAPIAATFNFEYNIPTLLTFSLSTSVSDNGSVDLMNTALVTGIDLPSGTAIYFQSGAGSGAYGALGGSGYGQFGGGGGPPPIPEPQTYAMLLAGLALIGAIARKRRPRGPITG